MSTSNRIGIWLTRAALTATAVILAIMFYWLVLDTRVPIEVYSQNVTPREVVPGGVVTISGTFEKFTDAPGVIYTRYVCDGVLYPAPEVVSLRGVTDGVVDSTFRVTVPPYLPVGVTCVREATGEYRVNPLVMRTAHWVSEPFEIVAPQE